MKTCNLPNLWASYGLSAVPQCCQSIKVGSQSGDLRNASSKRPPDAAAAMIRYSGVALVIDKLLTGSGNPVIGQIGDTFYFEDEGVPFIITSKNLVRCREEDDAKIDPGKIMLALFVMNLTLAPASGNQELVSAFKDAVDEYTYAAGNVSPNTMALICDNFYYTIIRPNQKVTYNTIIHPTQKVTVQADLNLFEVEAKMRAEGGMSFPSILDDTEVGRTPKFVGKKEKTRRPAKKKENPFIKDCLDGKYVVPYKWTEEQADYIQPLNAIKDFIPNQAFYSLLTKIKARTNRVLGRMQEAEKEGREISRVEAIGMDYINVTLTGKPGTGKTRLAYALGSATGMPVYTVSCSHNTDEDEFCGMTKMVDGKPTAVPTDTLRAFENGGILLLEEINLPQPAVVMGALGQATEFPFILKKDGYMPIRRHPLCIIISTMNTGTAGSKVLSQPLANRFKQSFVLNDPKKEDFVKILQNTGAPKEACSWVYEVYTRIVSFVENENAMADVESILLSLSMRSCIGALENMQEGMDPRDAVRNSIVGKIAEQDAEVAENCEIVLRSLPEPQFEVETI